MNTKVTFFIGLNDKDSKKQIISTDDAKTIICKAIVKYFEFGGTLTPCFGIYKMQDGTNIIVIEASFKVEILLFDNNYNDRCNRFENVLKRVLNQETILEEITTVEANFI